jgi:site-specific DNA-methyltransferase (cytosine-N4-specific)
MLRSHIEARVNPDEYPSHYIAQEIIKSLEQRRSNLNNPRIPLMLKGYFVDMELVIKEFARILTPNSWAVMVVGNVRYDGETIPVDTILCDIAESVGFDVKAIWIARYKGNSSQQMKKYGRLPVRESVLIWRKRTK